jgi:hypothetical protein
LLEIDNDPDLDRHAPWMPIPIRQNDADPTDPDPRFHKTLETNKKSTDFTMLCNGK